MTPMNKFEMKKYPIIMTQMKNIAAYGDYISSLWTRSIPLLFEARYITDFQLTAFDIMNKVVIASIVLSKFKK
jgi:hypothetical protein